MTTANRSFRALLSCCVLGLAACGAPTAGSSQQTFTNVASTPAVHGLHIGDPISALTSIGRAPDHTEKLGPYDATKWDLAHDGALSVSAKDGQIAYIEYDWAGDPAEAQSDFPGMTYGVTTLADIRSRFESNGIAYTERTPVEQVQGGIVFSNSYEVADQVVTFITEISSVDAQAVHDEGEASVPNHAKLIALIISSPHYNEVWGTIVRSPGYQPIHWQ